MKPAGRVGDRARTQKDTHGCPACPHEALGPAVEGSPDVLLNRRPALRVGDPGIHAVCCGSNTWKASAGASWVLINNRLAYRRGDPTEHCGAPGVLIEGSANVLIGDRTSLHRVDGDDVTEVCLEVLGFPIDGAALIATFSDGTTKRVPVLQGKARIHHPRKRILYLDFA